MQLALTAPTFSVVTSDDGTYCEVLYKGLIQGMGHSLGNAMRRTLRSCIPGYAPLGYKILNVADFSEIPEVIEDSVRVADNVAGIRLKVLDPAIDTFILGYQGLVKGDFRAKDFNTVQGPIPEIYKDGKVKADSKYYLPDGGFNTELYYKDNVKVLNPEHVIFTVGTDAGTTKNILVKCGSGVYFTTADDKRKLGSQEDINKFITTRSLFNPVLEANYAVENDSKFTESLRLSVRTTGAVSPTEAIHFAFQVLLNYCNVMGSVNMVKVTENLSRPFGESDASQVSQSAHTEATSFGKIDKVGLASPIEILRFDEVSHNLFKINGYNNLNDLLEGVQTKKIDEIFKEDLPFTKEELINKLYDIGIKEVKELDKSLMS